MTLLLLLCTAAAPVDSLYSAGDYEAVVEQSPAALAEPGVTYADSIRINTIYASALVSLGRSSEAATLFRRMLTRQPDLALDPGRFSPKIRVVFSDVKSEILLTPPSVARVDTVFVKRRVPLSVLVPGIGQLHNHEPAKGWLFLSAAVLTVAGAGVSHVMYSRAHDRYLDASTPGEIVVRYDAANDWYRTRNITAGTALGIWLYSLIDAVVRL